MGSLRCAARAADTAPGRSPRSSRTSARCSSGEEAKGWTRDEVLAWRRAGSSWLAAAACWLERSCVAPASGMPSPASATTAMATSAARPPRRGGRSWSCPRGQQDGRAEQEKADRQHRDLPEPVDAGRDGEGGARRGGSGEERRRRPGRPPDATHARGDDERDEAEEQHHADQPELAERLRVERVRVAHGLARRGVALPPVVEAARADARDRGALERVEGADPHLVAALAGERAQAVHVVHGPRGRRRLEVLPAVGQRSRRRRTSSRRGPGRRGPRPTPGGVAPGARPGVTGRTGAARARLAPACIRAMPTTTTTHDDQQLIALVSG